MTGSSWEQSAEENKMKSGIEKIHKIWGELADGVTMMMYVTIW